MLRPTYDKLVVEITNSVGRVNGERLRSLAVYGSVARGTMPAYSDIDILIVAEPLPKGRLARMTEFQPVELLLREPLAEARGQGVDTIVSPVFSTISRPSRQRFERSASSRSTGTSISSPTSATTKRQRNTTRKASIASSRRCPSSSPGSEPNASTLAEDHAAAPPTRGCACGAAAVTHEATSRDRRRS